MANIRINNIGSNVTVNLAGAVTSLSVNFESIPEPQLDTPSTLTANVISNSQIDLIWTTVLDGENYQLERSLSGTSGWSSVYIGPLTSHSDTSLAEGIQYYYRVKALASGYTDSNYSSNASGITTSSSNVPVIYKIASSTDGAAVNITYDRAMADPTGLHSSFSWKQNGVDRTFTSAVLIGTDTIQLTCINTIAEGDEVLISYTPGSIQSSTGELMYSMGDAPVTNYRTTSDVPSFDKWRLLIDARDSSKMQLTGNNITRLFDSAPGGRFFDPLATAYATYDSINSLINIIHASTNEYVTQYEFRKPTNGKFSFAVKFKSPLSTDTGADQRIDFLRHSVNGAIILGNWLATPATRNMRVFTTADYWPSTGGSSIFNDGNYYYIVVTYDGTNYKLWRNGTLFTRTITISTVALFNRIFQSNSTSRAPHGIKFLALGDYIDDTAAGSLNTFLSSI